MARDFRAGYSMQMQPSISLIADMVRYHASVRPGSIATVFGGRETTFGELDRRASQVANGLASEGLKQEARVAVLDKNSDLFFEIMFGAAKARDVLVAVNWRLSPGEAAYVIRDAAAEILFVGQEFIPAIRQVLGELGGVRKIIALSGDHQDWESYESWRNRQTAAEPVIRIAGDDVVLQMYTSGTTGHPKGALLTNDNILELIPIFVREWSRWSDEDVNLVCMPVYHIGGSGYACSGFYVGARTIILREVAPDGILRAIEEHRVTRSFFVPAVLLFMLEAAGINETDFSSLHLIVYGASPIPIDLLTRAMNTFKCRFAQVYGMTETSGAVTWLPPEDHVPGSARMRSCGKPHNAVEIRIVDSLGRDVPTGEVGEVICRSSQVMKGYWNLPGETAAAVRDGWFHSGDAGYLDEDGYLYIHDRIKDMIISGGENIYPAEVESVLFSHPAVADVAVIGVPDERWGESVKAIVVKTAGAEATGDELIEFARERIAHYKAPKTIDFVDALPRNPSGKILKRQLRSRYWEGRERQVG